MKGRFITFEGIEGSGKSTQMAVLADDLRKEGWEVALTREPGGTKLGEGIRELLLDARNHEMALKTELLLYLASRAQHLEEMILPALEKGHIVLCDRFGEATVAYQGYGRRLPLDRIRELNRYVTEGRSPDLTLLLDVEARRGLARIRSRSSRDRLEQERVEFYERVRRGYLKLAQKNPRRMVVINANRNFQAVARDIRRATDALLRKTRAKHRNA